MAVGAAAGALVGWQLRGVFIEEGKVECSPCACQCQCVVPTPESSGSWSGILVIALLLVAGIVVANFALVFKVSVSQKGTGSELNFHLKGKSKGLYNPARPLSITG